MATTAMSAGLQELVRRLTRPIDFASRDAYAHLTAVKNLGPFISQQIVGAMAEHVYLPSVETDLLAVRELFVDYDQRLDPKEQQRRLATARTILSRLGEGGARKKAPARSSDPPRAAGPPPELWNLSVRYARGVGPKRAALLERLGIRTVEEALWFLPWRYEDRSVITPIGQLTPGSVATIRGRVHSSHLKRTFRRGLSVLTVQVEDETGRIAGRFFNQPFLEPIMKAGAGVMMTGTVAVGRHGWTDLHLENPQYEVLGDEDEGLHVGRLVPVYHETCGLSSRHLRVLIKALLEDQGHAVEDILPPEMRQKYGLPMIQEALSQVHFPQTGTPLEALNRGVTPAHRRLAFEECLLLELALAMRHHAVKEETKGIRFDVQTPLLQRLRAWLPFDLTAAQRRVIEEVAHDMGSDGPMNRLVQGDVGCGKTMVALHAIVIACGSGHQAAFMVPTEILAEQHYLNLRGVLETLGLHVVLLRSGGSLRDRRAVLTQIQSGQAQVVIGTHALLQKHVAFSQLGLAVIDEQHKFGVLQRKTLVDKGYQPDVLVLTATPIPRTLALTVYGDLDISVIDALPPNRSPIRTGLFPDGQRRKAYQIVREAIAAGRQAYIVYPLVEESEKMDLQAAMQAAERLQAEDFHGYRVGLLHGRMKTQDKERVMAAFQAGTIQILVATTVIEVGVDVSNATVMLIEHADRFGLAQLHQLRGRVGRGRHQSYCLLVTSSPSRGRTEKNRMDQPSSVARERLDALVQSTDGFVIAEEDLRIRGPGDFFGVRQWGVPEFRAANLMRDRLLLEQAREEAGALLTRDPRLDASAHRPLLAATLRRWKDTLDLGSVS